jgi:hypothetical protein
MSTVGDMDITSSRMMLYEKASFTAVPGGYRLLSSRVNNYTNQKLTSGEFIEGNGYVAFDLFVKNDSGVEYYANNDPLNEEAIYLTDNSVVKVASNGEGGQANSGIENSVRVAFVQLGRVSKDATKALAQGITCNEGESPTSGVTGLCDEHPETIGEETYTNGLGFTWNIWEPNHTQHNELSKAHLDLICRVRSNESTYTSDLCVDDWDSAGYLTTYAIKDTIESSFNVNIYDGLNGYTGSSAYLQAMDYFTDEDKMAGDPDELFYLAPNSVTKLRVYIYLEGQDIDNYDLGTYGKDIEIMFGFTKDKYSMSLDDGEPEINS